jgi:hypothetical protein
MNNGTRGNSRGKWWILTIRAGDWSIPSELPDGVDYLRGQRELGENGFEHWQLVAHFASEKRLRGVKSVFGGTAHCECTRSAAALEYVWKDETRLGDKFELGHKPVIGAVRVNWDNVRQLALLGQFDEIPSSVYVRYYSSLQRIYADNARAPAVERSCVVYWGDTGTGKSRKAFDENPGAFPKNPNTKWWTGYTNESAVIIDEFRGRIDVSYLLSWLDRYPVLVETKGSSRPLLASKFVITSNLAPKDWYPELDEETLQALLRRMTIKHFVTLYSFPIG